MLSVLLLERMTSGVDALLDCLANDILVKLLPLFNQTCIGVIDVMNPYAISLHCTSAAAVRSTHDSLPDSDQGCWELCIPLKFTNAVGHKVTSVAMAALV